jgi:hypothetical protein
MVRKLHRDSGARWSLAVRMIVKRPADLHALAFAVARGWIELSPGGRSARVTAEGWRNIQ